MNFSVFNILKKDFRLCWQYLAAWWALLLIKAYLILVGMRELLHPTPLPRYDPAHPESWTFYATLVSFLPVGLIILTYLPPILLSYIVALVLKADSPIDEKALWRTRPVARRTMFRAKLMFFGLFGILVPCVIETVLRRHFGFDARECLRGIVETALIVALWISVVASMAVLFKRIITGLLTYFAIALTSGNAYTALVDFHWINGNFFTSPQADFHGIGFGFVLGSLTVATVLVVVWQMYNGARQSRGAKILVGGLALAVGVAFLWRSVFWFNYITHYHDQNLPANGTPLVLHNLVSEQTSSNPGENSPVAATAVGTPIQVYSAFWSNTGNPQYDSHTLAASLSTQTFPELKDQVLWVKLAKTSLKWSDPKNQLLRNAPETLYWSSLLNQPAALAAAGYGRLAWKSSVDGAQFDLYSLTDEQFKVAANHPAQWTGELTGESGHFVKLADLEVRPGGSWWERNTRFVYGKYSLGPGPSGYAEGIQFHVTVIRPAYYLLGSPLDQTPHVFLLYNSRTRECMENLSDESYLAGNNSRPLLAVFSVFASNEPDLEFAFNDKLDENGRPFAHLMNAEEIRKWLADARLIVLRFVPDQTLTCTLTIDPFIVPKADTP